MKHFWITALLLLPVVPVSGDISALPPPEKRYAVIIGVDEYEEINGLKGAALDARRLRDALEHSCAFPKENIHVLATGEGRIGDRPTYENIVARIVDVLDKAPIDGLLLFAFSGHGQERDNDAFLLPTNVRMRVLDQTSVRLSWLHERIRSKRIQQVVLLLDACRNEPIGRGDDPNRLTEAYIRPTTFNTRNRDVSAYVTLYASSVGQPAYENKEERQGYFTSAVVDGLTGGAAAPNGDITLQSLVEHVQREVPKNVKRDLGMEQHPFLRMEGYLPQSLVLGNVPRVRSTARPNAMRAADAYSHAAALKAYRAADFGEARRILQKGVDDGNAEAMCELGRMSYLCLGAQCNFSEASWLLESSRKHGFRAADGWLAMFWLTWGVSKSRAIDYARSSANRGELAGRLALGAAYERGAGLVAKDPAKAAENYTKSLPDLRDKVAAGDPWAQNRLGNFYALGQAGLPRDGPKSLELYGKAARQGFAVAQTNLGVIYQHGMVGVRRDENKAVEYYRAAEAQGQPNGQYRLGTAYLHGLGDLEPDNEKAVALFSAAADAGDAKARSALGFMHETGRGGLNKDLERAAELYQQAADDADPFGQFRLALLYERGVGGLVQDAAKAAELYALASNGHPGAQYQLGTMYELGRGGLTRDIVKAAELFRQSSESGHASAHIALGRMYQNGAGGLPRDYSMALKFYGMAAAQGHPGADTALARMYVAGTGVPQNVHKAVELLAKAAEEGDTSADTALANIYMEGLGGIGRDEAKAVQLLEKAAALGNPSAQNNLGVLYAGGRAGVKQDDVKAVQLFEKASQQGEARALTNLARMYIDARGGLLENFDKAIELFQKAAEQDEPHALNNLGVFHEEGRGDLPRNRQKAIEYYRRAADLKFEPAIRNLERALLSSNSP